MSIIKGRLEQKKLLNGEKLTRRQAIMANCYVCNGEEEGGEDCKSTDCPFYQYFPYRDKKPLVAEAQNDVLNSN